MAATTSWLSLTDLGRIYGISAIHCGKTLEHQGWRDRRGRPTQSALDANAAMQTGPHGQGRTVLWNRSVCSQLLEHKGYEPAVAVIDGDPTWRASSSWVHCSTCRLRLIGS